MKKQSACLTTAALLCALLLLACNDGASGTENETTAVSERETEAVDTAELTEMEKRMFIEDDLPDVSFDGAQFRISARSWYSEEVDIGDEEEKGDVLGDALYRRNLAVEERFNVEIVPVYSDDEEGHILDIRKSVMAGDNDFDIALTYAYLTGQLITSNCYLNWYDMPYNDFSAVWWIGGINDKLSIGDALYTAVGDMCISTLELTYAVYYNRMLGATYDIDTEEMFGRVFDGTWTHDYFLSLFYDIYSDINGNGKRDFPDLYGFAPASHYQEVDVYPYAFDIPIMQKDASGIPQVVLNSEKTVEAIEKIHNLYWETVGTYVDEEDVHGGGELFINGRALFTTATLGAALGAFRDMTDDYTILPYPKWDENQDMYRTNANDDFSFIGIPTTATDIEMISVITEALNIESYKILYPAYYEVALKEKYARDAESLTMIDLVMQGRNFDFSVLFSPDLDRLSTLFRRVINNKSKNFASEYKSGERMRTRTIERIVKAYEENTLS